VRALCRLVATVLTSVAVIISGPPVGAAPVLDVVSVSQSPTQSNAGLFIADREGDFAARGIRIQWVPFQGGAQLTPVLAQGRLDVGAGTVSAAFFNAVAAGLKVRIVAAKGHVAGRGTVGSLVVRRDLAAIIRSAEDLRGRRIAINATGALGHYLVAQILARARLSLDEVTLVTIPSPAAVGALQGRSIDVAVLPAPLDVQAIAAGVGSRLVDFADVIPGEPTAFVFMGPTLLDHNRPLGIRFLAAYLRALQRYNQGPTSRNVETVAAYTGLDREVVRRGGWIGIHADGSVDINRVRRYQDWLYEIGLIAVRSPITAVIETALLEQARSEVGLPTR
jgi:NitT/TauT family transport system substrate-binding protein